jgi:preprotein translocase subunit SecD
LLLGAGCALFQKRTAPDAPAAPQTPGSSRRVTVQFHLAGDAPAEGRSQMQSRSGEFAYVDPQPALTRADVSVARAYHGQSGSFVEIEFNFEGRYALADLTRAHNGERLAILIDGELHTAPRIGGEIGGGRAFISKLSHEEADAVAASLSR